MIRRLLHLILRRPGIQRHTVQHPGWNGVSEYEREEGQILGAVVWSDCHDPDDEYCMCRDCHLHTLLYELNDEGIRHELADMVRHDPLLRQFDQQRVRGWTR